MRPALALALGLFALGCAAPVGTDPSELDPEQTESEAELASPEAEGVVPGEAMGGMALPHELRFVVADADPKLVLDTSGDFLAPSGPIELLQVPGDVDVGLTSFRAFTEGDLEQPMRELVSVTEGARFVLYGASGALCTVVAGEVGVLHRADFDSAWLWREDPPEPGGEAERAWELGAGSALVTAKTSPVDGDCAGARYALPESSRKPRIWSAQPEIDGALARASVAALRALPEWLAIQDELVDSGGRGLWDELEGTAPLARLWRDGEGGGELVLVSASAGAGCGEFGGSLWALFERSARGLVVKRVSTGWDLPDHVLDADRDGKLELFSGDALDFEEDGEARTVDIRVPSAQCPC